MDVVIKHRVGRTEESNAELGFLSKGVILLLLCEETVKIITQALNNLQDGCSKWETIGRGTLTSRVASLSSGTSVQDLAQLIERKRLATQRVRAALLLIVGHLRREAAGVHDAARDSVALALSADLCAADDAPAGGVDVRKCVVRSCHDRLAGPLHRLRSVLSAISELSPLRLSSSGPAGKSPAAEASASAVVAAVVRTARSLDGELAAAAMASGVGSFGSLQSITEWVEIEREPDRQAERQAESLTHA